MLSDSGEVWSCGQNQYGQVSTMPGHSAFWRIPLLQLGCH
ncbi:MAG: RCC1-like domain-containing protein [bacterium]